MFLEILELRHQYQEGLALLKREHPTAAAQGRQACCRSAVCCWRRPGELHPDDVPRIAAHLGLTPQELFRRWLVVDKINGRLVVLPRRVHQQELAGHYVPLRETYSLASPCVFLVPQEQNACRIHEVKPYGCRNFECWSDAWKTKTKPVWSVDALQALGWDAREEDQEPEV